MFWGHLIPLLFFTIPSYLNEVLLNFSTMSKMLYLLLIILVKLTLWASPFTLLLSLIFLIYCLNKQSTNIFLRVIFLKQFLETMQVKVSAVLFIFPSL